MAFAGSASPASLSVVVDVSGRQFNLQDVCVVHVSMWTGDLRTITCAAAWLLSGIIFTNVSFACLKIPMV